MSSPEAEKTKTRRPKDTNFKQQKLPAWQPILTANTVLPMLFAIGVAFIPLGIGFLITANNVHEKIVDYTNCVNENNISCDGNVEEYPGAANCTCYIMFTLTEDFKDEVYLYYSLTGYYQNHRRYVKSRDNVQLHGGSKNPVTECKPFDYFNNGSKSMPYAPCGAIANSMFNDTLSLSYFNGSDFQKVGLLKQNLAWSTDRTSKYKNPDVSVRINSVPPPNWHRSIWDGNETQEGGYGYLDEDLMVWMRTAALPSFRKLYRRIDHVGTFGKGLPKGNYSLRVEYNYPVTAFGGTKRMILSTSSWLGGKNPFLGIAYIVVGGLCIVVGFVFLIIHIRIGKSSDEMTKNMTRETIY